MKHAAHYIMFCFPCSSDSPFSMTSELDSSLTSIDWLPQLGISTLRSGKERVERKKDRGRDKDLPPIPPVTPASNSKTKPPHSYATLIAMAISSAPERKMSLNDIYTWISDTFPYYSRAGRGWKVKTTTWPLPPKLGYDAQINMQMCSYTSCSLLRHCTLLTC